MQVPEVLITRPKNFDPELYRSMAPTEREPLKRKRSERPPKSKTRTAPRPAASQQRRTRSRRSPEPQPRAHRATSQKQMTRNNALELMKRRRQRLEPAAPAQEDPYESASEVDSLFDEIEDDEQFEENFIVKDDGAKVVLPTGHQLQDDEEMQIKKIVQFMVFVAVHPPAERKSIMEKLLEDEYFLVPLERLRRRMKGLVVILKSTRWSIPFTNRLERHPDLVVQEVSTNAASKICIVCHKTQTGNNNGHRAVLSGFPYDQVGYQELPLKPGDMKERTYDMGFFCAKRVYAFHRVFHWERNLFVEVRKEIDQMHEIRQGGRLVNDRDISIAVDNDRIGAPKDLQDANAINDWFAKRGFVKLLEKKIKDILADGEGAEKDMKGGKSD
uniref:DUF4211 domain-containing protein n=1 Tax=Mycena chlorophos TaxID=658473 RepID=A0ABQ0LPZ4_MYCCL|nr:predicted protein [Mycena chlorophos]